MNTRQVKRALTAAILFLAAFFSVNAQDISVGDAWSPAPDAVIRAFRVEGLQRTKVSVVQPLYSPYIGKPWAEFPQDELIQDLRGLGIFNPEIRILPEDVMGTDGTQVDAVIFIEEKWTLIPLPIAGQTNSGRIYGGLAVLESNLFGYHKMVYAMGLVSTAGMQGMFGYVEPSLFGSDFGFNFNFGAGRNEKELVTEKGKKWQEYETRELGVHGELTWKAEDFSAGVHAGYAGFSVNDDYESAFSPPDSARFAVGGLSLRYAKIRYGSSLSYGFASSARYDYARSLKTDVDSYSQYEADVFHYFELPGEHRLGFSASGLYVKDAPLIMEREIGGSLFKTLPEGVIADAAVSAQAALEFIVFRFSWGAVTAQAAWEAGVFSRRVLREYSLLTDDTDGPSWSHGPGLGGRLYLAKVALPALGLDVYYNARAGDVYSSVYFGVSF